MQIVNISAYKFVTLDDIETLRPVMRDRCDAAGLKGTILLAPEGINMFLAGTREQIDAFMAWLTPMPGSRTSRRRKACPKISRSSACWCAPRNHHDEDAADPPEPAARRRCARI
jgi:predicted sulfurtransferase